VSALATVIKDEIDRWGVGEIERLLFGVDDPEPIAEIISGICREHLGSPPADALFYRGSAGCVFGVALANGSEVVLKVYQERWGLKFLEAAQSVQRNLAAAGFPCAAPVLGPRRLPGSLRGLVTAETLLPDPGMRPLAGAADRAASASALGEQIRLGRLLLAPGLTEHPLRASADGLYPEPHSPLFDFGATAEGAGWIDSFATRARDLRDADPTPPSPAHTDWSARNVRVVDGRIVAVYDWDSLALTTETTALGQAAITWKVTSEPGGSEFPDLTEVIAFLNDYEEAAGREFTPGQRRAAGAAATWVLAYIARCEHSLCMSGKARSDQHGARDCLASDGESLLALG
jgi:hypothetical protein